MEMIQLISTSIVKPENGNNSGRRIELTPFDIPFLVAEYVHRGLLFLKPANQLLEELLENNAIHHIKKSLSKALDVFPPLAGRLVAVESEDKTNTSFFVDCNGCGSQFVHAEAVGVSVGDIVDAIHVPNIVNSFFPMDGVYNCEGISNPVFALQVTELLDGFFLGFAYNHVVADGTSFWNFLSSFSEISKRCWGDNQTLLQQPRPVLGYWFLDNAISDHPIWVPNSAYQETVSQMKLTPRPNLVQRVFHFSKGKIGDLKANANSEMGTTKISSLQAILGHLWRSVTRSRFGLRHDQETYCMILVNLRHRLKPRLAGEYFGSVVQFGTATATVGEVLAHGPGWAALQINNVVAMQTEGDHQSREHMEKLVKSLELKKLGDKSSGSKGLVVAGSQRFKIYENDLGWGKPVAARGGPSNSYDGKITVFPGVDEGSVDVTVSLFPETLHRMENVAEFMEAVSTS